jgi:TP901 family phage tail tape measure protein
MAVVSRVEIALDSTKAAANAKNFAKSMDGVAGATHGASGRLNDAKGKFLGAGKAAAAAGAGAKAAVPGVTALGTAFKAALGPIAVLTTAAGALTSAFSILSKQDFAEAKVRSLGVDSEELTKRLSDVSRELAGQADVVELTGAAYDVASAGFTNAADAANILKAASLGATGGFSDINTVGDAATSVLNAYGLEADKAGKLVDGFIQTQNDGKIVIGQYAANIAKVAPVAAALGVPLEEVNAAVAQITAGGQGAEVTFTALKTAFSAIAAGKVGKEFEGLGIEINASTLKADGLAGTLKKIEKSGADAGTVIKAFGTEAGPSILALLNNTEKYNQLLENQEQSQGAAAKAAFEASDTINGALKRLQTAFTNIFADQSELGILLKGTFQVAAVTVEVFGAALKILLAPIRGVVSGVQAFFQALSPFKENINLAYELEQGFQAVMKGVSLAADVITGLYFKISQGAATVIGNVLTLANNIREAVVGVFSGLASTIKQVMAGLFEQLPAPIKFIIEQASKGYKAVSGFLGQAVSGVASKISGTVQELAAVGGALNKSDSVTPAANKIQQTNGPLASGTTSKDADNAAKIAQASADRVRSLEDQAFLASALTQEESKQFQRQIEIRELLENKQGLTKTQLQAEVEALTNLHSQVDATQKIKEENAVRLQQAEDLKEKEKALAEAQAAAAEKLQGIYDQIGQSIASGVVDTLSAAVDQTKSLADAAANTLRNVASILLKLGVNTALQSTGLGIFSGLAGFANGGRPPVGKPSIVGERGPELFVPNTSGTIVPNNKLGGGGATNVVVNVDAKGSSASGDSGAGKQLGGLIGAAVQAELIKQQRPGGLLSS